MSSSTAAVVVMCHKLKQIYWGKTTGTPQAVGPTQHAQKVNAANFEAYQ